MASRKNSNGREAEVTKAQEVLLMPLGDIEANYGWNTRTVGAIMTEASGGPDGKDISSRQALISSIEADGQDTAVTVRPRESSEQFAGKKGPPFLLVVGFRRFDAIQEVSKRAGAASKFSFGPDQQKAGTIKIIVRELNDKQAIALNVRENAEREDLSVPDQAWGVKRLREAGYTQIEVAKEMGRGQSYVSKLEGILALDEQLFTHWREALKPLTVDQALTVAKLPKQDQKAKYDEVWKGRAAAAAGPSADPDPNAPAPWLIRVENRAKEIGETLAQFEFTGIISGVNQETVRDAIDKLIKFPNNANVANMNTAAKGVVKAYMAKLKELNAPPAPKTEKPKGNAAGRNANTAVS